LRGPKGGGGTSGGPTGLVRLLAGAARRGRRCPPKNVGRSRVNRGWGGGAGKVLRLVRRVLPGSGGGVGGDTIEGPKAAKPRGGGGAWSAHTDGRENSFHRR